MAINLSPLRFLSHLGLSGGRAGWWRVDIVAIAVVRRLRRLELNALLLTISLAIVALVRAIVRVLRWLCGVWWCGLVVVVVVVWLCLARPCSPTSTVVGHSACATSSASCYAPRIALESHATLCARRYLRAEDEEEEEAKDDYDQNNPAHPVIPGAAIAVSVTIVVSPASGHCLVFERSKV